MRAAQRICGIHQSTTNALSGSSCQPATAGSQLPGYRTNDREAGKRMIEHRTRQQRTLVTAQLRDLMCRICCSLRATDSGSKEIAFDCSSFRLYMDGRVDRNPHRTETMPAGFDADTGVDSKDVVIDAATGATVRLYLPPLQGAATTTKLPILVFFHGGYFIVGSATEPMYHRYVNTLVARARVVAVSVEYRLAPEHPLPAAYDDSWPRSSGRCPARTRGSPTAATSAASSWSASAPAGTSSTTWQSPWARAACRASNHHS
ncbi:hypothetical protein C2845_PM03G36730 [Panicum miliaceum]|uniref:Alpha/beta hydrolase fold-3 domain-containing protein n=1 Tax=Panicum miliaceum TaxID=4540 RepID=A0A3L6T774_PANMI|nr:hypothetical protein C2845_PM03G36730 [Panicum miliaceum]